VFSVLDIITRRVGEVGSLMNSISQWALCELLLSNGYRRLKKTEAACAVVIHKVCTLGLWFLLVVPSRV
jgi:hypothetical protein